MAEDHLVHFQIHRQRPTLRRAGFLQGHFDQWPVLLSGVRWWRCKWGNDLPFLVSLNDNDKLKTKEICFWTVHTASHSFMGNWATLFFCMGTRPSAPALRRGPILWLQSRESGLRLHRHGSGTLLGKLPQTHDQISWEARHAWPLPEVMLKDQKVLVEKSLTSNTERGTQCSHPFSQHV